MAINSLGMNVKQAISDFDEIKQAIEDKGVVISDGTPTSDYKYKVNEIPYYPWVRPKDRPAIPVILDGEQVFYALFGVSENGANDYAIQFRTNGAPYVVEWGDGVVQEYASNTKAEHVYSFSGIKEQPKSEGYKWVWIKCYPTTGWFVELITNVLPSTQTKKYTPQVFEIYMECTDLQYWVWELANKTTFAMLDRLYWYGTNAMYTFQYFLANSYNLQELIVDTGKGTSFNYFLINCRKFNQKLYITTNNAGDCRGFLQGCIKFNQPLDFNFGKIHSMNLFMAGCANFNQPIDFSTMAGVSSLGSFMQGCSSFNQPVNFPTTPTGSYVNSFFQGNYSYNQPIQLDTSKMIYFSGTFSGMESYSHGLTVDLLSATTSIGSSFIGTTNYAMTGLRLLNMSNIHNMLTISNSNLNAQKLELLFGDLCNRTGLTAGVITITGCYGTPSLTNVQKAICVSKNWTIVL